MSRWTPESINALAPDPASASAGKALANVRKWTALGASDRALWGLCQGSGKDPYQTRIDLSEPAFKCSCPSRKFPCKHGLALFLLFTTDTKSFSSSPEPTWVTDWLTTRAQSEQKRSEKAKAVADKPIDEAAQAKRAATRDDRVRDGVSECRTWLHDLIRKGLAAARSESSTEWDRIAARMVDAQAPGLAAHIRRFADSLSSGDNWEPRSLDLLGRLHLLLEAATKLDSLPPDLATDVRTALGYSQSKDDATNPTSDNWAILAQSYHEDQRLTARRTWLLGRASLRPALILEYSPGNNPTFDTALIPGSEFQGDLAFFRGRQPLRALVTTRSESRPLANSISNPLLPQDHGSISANLARYAAALAQSPWLTHWPMLLTNARLAREGDRAWLCDPSGSALPLRPTFAASLQSWKLLSATGARESTIAAEWDGEFLVPLSAFIADSSPSFCDLSPRWAS